jgi:hypothetical protein
MNTVIEKCGGGARMKSILAVIGALVLVFADALPIYAQQNRAQSSQLRAKAAATPLASQGPALEASNASNGTNGNQDVAAPATESTGKGSHEGIKVHGHWMIEVRNPDGEVVTRREFENAITQSGINSILLSLGGGTTTGGIAIGLNLRNPYAYPVLINGSGPKMYAFTLSFLQAIEGDGLGAQSAYLITPATGSLNSVCRQSVANTNANPPGFGTCSNNLSINTTASSMQGCRISPLQRDA